MITIAKIVIPKPYPKQIEFFEATTKYINYGGARAGGKSWAARIKSVLLAMNYDGIQILLLRRTYTELVENHLIPLISLLMEVCKYHEKSKSFNFPNGSRIKLGYCDSEKDVLQYQGQAYDVIFMEEATQFTEFQFQSLTESNRPSGMMKVPFTSRMYFTCNPGGVGHQWVKRLFVDRIYQGLERPEDYTFIQAKVYDNEYVLKNNPDYVRTLENLPDKRKRAMLHGEWDVYEGQYFAEFNRDIHVVKPFKIPNHWNRYFAIDYGLDMLAGYWIAVDTYNRAYVYKEIHESNLIVSAAAQKVKAMTTENIIARYAPPDLWNRNRDTGKSTADIFAENGLSLVKVSNDRVQGWLNMKEWLKPFSDEQGQTIANIRIFENCTNLIKNIPLLQFDEKNPNDCSTSPHEITHAPDALRYFISGRPAPTIIKNYDPFEPENNNGLDGFLSFGG